MDRKSKITLNRYMQNEMSYMEQYNVSPEEIAYEKEHGAILEDLPITNEEAILLLSQSLKQITLSDVADAFLYSLSTRDMEYRYVLASYVYAVSWFKFDKGKTEEVRKLQRTFYIWLKHCCGGGIWGGIEKPIYYVSEFVHMEKRIPTDEDYRMLKEILTLANSMEEKSTSMMLCRKIMKHKILRCNKREVVGILETLAICGVLETPEHQGFLDVFTPLRGRDTGDLRQSLSYPLNWWHGKNGVNFTNVKRVFNLDML